MSARLHDDGRGRCPWCGADALYVHYHDTDWGVPERDSRALFEKLVLDGFQAGLAWITILRKRDNFRAAFDNFDHEKIAHYGEADVARLLADKGIVRHQGKIRSVINNAQRAKELIAEAGSLAAFFWRFEPEDSERPERVDLEHLRANPTTEVSKRISKELKRRGWSFVGPTTVYAFMQAMGLVNDHIEGCICRPAIERERHAFVRPR